MLPLAEGAAGPPKSDTGSVLLAVGLLIVLTVVGGLLILYVRKRMLSKSGEDDTGATMMEQLRRMRDQGEISEEEFETTRRTLRERLKQSLKSPPASDTPSPLRKKSPR